jgi:hypothetical protein
MSTLYSAQWGFIGKLRKKVGVPSCIEVTNYFVAICPNVCHSQSRTG